MDLAREYRAAREGAAAALLEGPGLLALSGPDRRKFLHGLVTRDTLGASLALDGDTAAVAQSSNVGGAGPVFVFSRSGATWGAISWKWGPSPGSAIRRCSGPGTRPRPAKNCGRKT